MTDDPIVLILREAAARGRQLRLAREQAARSETRSDGNVSEVLLSDQGVGTTLTSQRSDNAADNEHSALNHTEVERIREKALWLNAK